MTLIDLPLFKAIQPEELISCKWMSRDKLQKAPNIVHFTRRFNQTTFWCQKEILNCKRIETRGKMISHFIKIAKRLNELHSFNSLMAIIVALKAAPIYRLKKTWSQHVSKRDVTQFERLADLMFDTSDNKRKMRDMHMNCKLPCIPFLGLFLTDLIHIDIAHPHNSFDNPQRRNQMNNICRLISEYQQSNYQDLTSLSCNCCFSSEADLNQLVNEANHDNTHAVSTNNDRICVISNCNCGIHHGHGYAGGIINNDGTIYISHINYVQNYLNSFLYIEELQKFKEDENYKESLELEPDESCGTDNNPNVFSPSVKHHLSSHHSHVDSKSNTNAQLQQMQQMQQHRKTLSLTTSLFTSSAQHSNVINETKDFLNEYKLRHHPLDDSIVESNTNLAPVLPTEQNSQHHILLNEKQLLNTVKLNEPQSLLKDLLKQRHGSVQQSSGGTLKIKSNRKFNCYSSSVDQDSNDETDSKSTPVKVLNRSQGSESVSRNMSRGRNLIANLIDETVNTSTAVAVAVTNNSNNQHTPEIANRETSSSQQTNTSNSNTHTLHNTNEIQLILTDLNNQLNNSSLIQFESPVKRKCIIKNCRKPRFTQWKSYWLQLVAGNLLIYYPAKTIMFSKSRNYESSNKNTPIKNMDNQTDVHNQSESNAASNNSMLQQQHRKTNFHKNPCKMHPIANWMVVNLFQDKENEILNAINVNHTKFDIQLNDLNNGNMYKYRFDNLELAKFWFDQFKLAINYHERQKPDNLIRFD